MTRVGIMETAIRDGHQSLLATRMRTEDMIPVLEQMDEIGYHSIECWGGAAFDAVKRAGGHVQGTICYTISPVHTVDKFAKMADTMVEMGADSLCIKDMAGL